MDSFDVGAESMNIRRAIPISWWLDGGRIRDLTDVSIGVTSINSVWGVAGGLTARHFVGPYVHSRIEKVVSRRYFPSDVVQ
jgi:hypothetical protein